MFYRFFLGYCIQKINHDEPQAAVNPMQNQGKQRLNSAGTWKPCRTERFVWPSSHLDRWGLMPCGYRPLLFNASLQICLGKAISIETKIFKLKTGVSSFCIGGGTFGTFIVMTLEWLMAGTEATEGGTTVAFETDTWPNISRHELTTAMQSLKKLEDLYWEWKFPIFGPMPKLNDDRLSELSKKSNRPIGEGKEERWRIV